MSPKNITKLLILIGVGVIAYPVIAGVFEFMIRIWYWRPSFAVGLVMIVLPILLAYPLHYFLNVRRTSSGGTVQVNGFGDYIQHLMLNGVAHYGSIASIFVRIFFLLFGFSVT